MGFKRVFKLNFKISLVLGGLGFVFYLIFSPIEKRNNKNYKYIIYTARTGKSESALYVKKKSNIEKLYLKEPKNFLRTGQDIYFLSKDNKAWILDTIGENIVKFRAKRKALDGSECTLRGYTLIENIHMQ